MSSGLRKSTKSNFIPPLLPSNMDNTNNYMETDNFDITESYPTPGQKVQQSSPGYDSDVDLDLNETTLVSSASKVEEYQKTVEESIKAVDNLMFQRHRIATIKHSIDQVDVITENPTLPNFLKFELNFTASCDEVSQNAFRGITNDLRQKGLQKLTTTLQETCAQIIREKNEELKKHVAETKNQLPVKDKEAGTHRAKYFSELDALKQKWTEKLNLYKSRAPKTISDQKRPWSNQPRSWSRGRSNGPRNQRTSQPSILQELQKLTKMFGDPRNKWLRVIYRRLTYTLRVDISKTL